MQRSPPVRRRVISSRDGTMNYSSYPAARKSMKQPGRGRNTSSVPNSRGPAETRVIRLENINSFEEIETEDLLNGISRLERRHKSSIDQLRSELGVGSSNVPVQSNDHRAGNSASSFYHAISSSLWEDLQQYRVPLTAGICFLIERDMSLAIRKKLHGRLWLAFHKELDAVQQALKILASPTNDSVRKQRSIPQSNPEALRALLYCMIGQAERELSNISAKIDHHISRSESEMMSDHKNVLQSLYTDLGDLARYKQLHRPKDEVRDWSHAEKFYHNAFRLRPGVGKPWNQLALIASLRKDNFAAFYHYLRSLCASEEACPAREPLLSLHERFKKQLSSLVGKSTDGVLPLSEHTHRFLVRLLVSCGACLARIDLSDFDKHLSAARLHLVMSLQLQLGTRVQNCGGSDGVNAMNISAARRRLPAHLTRVALMTLCTADACYASFVERNTDEFSTWKDDVATLNAVRLVFALVAAMAGATAAAGFGSSAPDWQHATLPAICIFLDWLQCVSHFGDGLKEKEPDAFRSTMSVLAGLCSATSLAPSAPSFTPLLEDIECQGLASLSMAVSQRLAGRVDPARDATLSAKDIHPGRVRIARVRQFAEWAAGRGWLERVGGMGGSSVLYNEVAYAVPGCSEYDIDDSSSYVEGDFEESGSAGSGYGPMVDSVNVENIAVEFGSDASNESIEMSYKMMGANQESTPFSPPFGNPGFNFETTRTEQFPSMLAQQHSDWLQNNLEESPEAMAVRAALADFDLAPSINMGENDWQNSRIGLSSTAQREEDMLPAGLFGMVMAGLGDPDERLCAVCCNTLGPEYASGAFCPYCGAAAGSAEPMASLSSDLFGAKDYTYNLKGHNTEMNGYNFDTIDYRHDLSNQVTNSSTKPDFEEIALHLREVTPVKETAVGGGILTNVNMADVAASYARSVPSGPPMRDQERGRGGKNGYRGGKSPSMPKGLPHLLVMDAPNIAMRHGLGKKFSAKGIRIAADHYLKAGHRVVGFIPQHYLDERRSLDPVEAALLSDMVDEGILVLTPPQDYDDSYCITYCMQHNGCVLTNDLYRDHYAALDSKKRDAARRWIKGHIISFTFVGDEFLPNPDFSFAG